MVKRSSRGRKGSKLLKRIRKSKNKSKSKNYRRKCKSKRYNTCRRRTRNNRRKNRTRRMKGGMDGPHEMGVAPPQFYPEPAPELGNVFRMLEFKTRNYIPLITRTNDFKLRLGGMKNFPDKDSYMVQCEREISDYKERAIERKPDIATTSAIGYGPVGFPFSTTDQYWETYYYVDQGQKTNEEDAYKKRQILLDSFDEVEKIEIELIMSELGESLTEENIVDLIQRYGLCAVIVAKNGDPNTLLTKYQEQLQQQQQQEEEALEKAPEEREYEKEAMFRALPEGVQELTDPNDYDGLEAAHETIREVKSLFREVFGDDKWYLEFLYYFHRQRMCPTNRFAKESIREYFDEWKQLLDTIYPFAADSTMPPVQQMNFQIQQIQDIRGDGSLRLRVLLMEERLMVERKQATSIADYFKMRYGKSMNISEFKSFLRVYCSYSIVSTDGESAKSLAALFEYVARPLNDEVRGEGGEKQWIDIRNFLLFLELFGEYSNGGRLLV